jgi:hypothetical protein
MEMNFYKLAGRGKQRCLSGHANLALFDMKKKAENDHLTSGHQPAS